MLTSIGAALAMLLAIYEYEMLTGAWAPIVAVVGQKFDASRYGAQVISGIGFLGAGTIMAAPLLKVSGLSTATGLFASACMGMAAGAGFLELVIIVVLLLIFVLELLYPMEFMFKRRLRNITVFVEFTSMDDLVIITDLIRELDGQLFEMDMENTGKDPDEYPSAVFFIFTDDKEWCRDHFKGPNFIVVDLEEGDGTDIAEMTLMSRCKHHIIANSSFSWWAAWLNDSPEKIVIAPEKWINNRDMDDIYTDRMTKIAL